MKIFSVGSVDEIDDGCSKIKMANSVTRNFLGSQSPRLATCGSSGKRRKSLELGRADDDNSNIKSARRRL